MGQTLEDLKAENAAEEAELSQAAPVEDEALEEVAEAEAEESSEVAELSEEETEEEEVESWMLADEQTSDDNAHFTGSDIKAAKSKLKAKLSKVEDEKVGMQAQIDALKMQLTGGTQPQVAAQQPSIMAYPTLESVGYDEDLLASQMQAYIGSQINAGISAATQTYTRQASNNQASQAMDKKVDDHYQRASELLKETGITEEVYQAADMRVRQVVESVLPGQGDISTDQMIARLGEGSEKVMFSVGQNAVKREKLRGLLLDDPTGLSAAMYLGEQKIEITKPVKRKSSAPKPAKSVKGGKDSDNASSFKRKYDAAKTANERINLKMDAKKQGVNTREW